MTNAEQLRAAMDIVESTNEASKKPIEKNVKVNIETMLRDSRFSQARYLFNKGFLTFQDLLDNPEPFIEKYRKDKAVDTSSLVGYMSGFKADPKFTDKQHYLRQGWEARGFTNDSTALIWYKEKQENLLIFARGKQALQEIRDFLIFYNIIRTS